MQVCYSADEARPVAVQRQVEEAAADRGVLHRRALAVEPGQEDELAGAGGGALGQGVEGAVDVLGRRLGAERVAADEDAVAQEGQALAGGLLLGFAD